MPLPTVTICCGRTPRSPSRLVTPSEIDSTVVAPRNTQDSTPRSTAVTHGGAPAAPAASLQMSAANHT